MITLIFRGGRGGKAGKAGKAGGGRKKAPARRRSYYEDEEEDSDFEDPDLIEVPGGGKSLQTLKNMNVRPKSDPNRPSTSGISKPKTIDLTGGLSQL